MASVRGLSARRKLSVSCEATNYQKGTCGWESGDREASLGLDRAGTHTRRVRSEVIPVTDASRETVAEGCSAREVSVSTVHMPSGASGVALPESTAGVNAACASVTVVVDDAEVWLCVYRDGEGFAGLLLTIQIRHRTGLSMYSDDVVTPLTKSCSEERRAHVRQVRIWT